ncbi:uncharacterized protein LOC115449183 [Manduca sexta]|uniref:uncharacterized protein LOC115449183 n=1 Tax=Manduca sexta TaxID=7130 RepID=UPI00188E5B79|nr:uncharacterized protein LOC115449183 [Manduca sexta]
MQSGIFISFLLLASLGDVDSLDFSAANRDNFGPFVASWHHYEVCRGPKPKNDTLFVTVLERHGDSYGASFNITAFTAARLDKIKISVYTIKGGVKHSLLWSYKLDNPCQHLVVGALFESEFNAKNCVLTKGFHHAYLNFTSLAHDFFGTSFFYGEFLFKAIILSKTGNIGCLNYNTVFSKKE